MSAGWDLWSWEFLREYMAWFRPKLARDMNAHKVSKTLAKSLILESGPWSATLHVPHYWAKYRHDGFGSFAVPNRKYIAFYPNKRNDPRLRGGYPGIPSQRLSLRSVISKELMRKHIREGKLIFRRAHPGIYRSGKYYPFFESAFTMYHHISSFPRRIERSFEQRLLEELKPILNVRDMAKGYIR